jgi:transcriptional regulator with XRE-family HTH domain
MKRFDDLPDKLTPHARRRIDARARKAAKEIGLDELRRARRMSQDELARTMETTQAHVSRLERRADLYLSTLRRYIRALGGELRIVATFNDGRYGELEIEQLADIEPPAEGATADDRIAVSYLIGDALPVPKNLKKASRRPPGATKRKRG